ncbi:MAG: cellulase family glycosylhydrolase, partial [Anaerolineae bacterium]|nr:glycoside hydrolase family 5 protein [Thermoflexales bacterium]MDW8408578.1 cellulase family glycosylhydrolase [Anaerolineae bacterium]
MSRYSFSPRLDPNRQRRRRLALGAIGFGALMTGGIVLFVLGLRALTGSGASPAATAKPFVPVVTILAPGVQTTIEAPASSSNPGAQPPDTVPSGTMDPRGALPGLPDFVCPSPRPAPTEFGYGIQSNWPVGDIGQFNTIMAEQLKMNWTKAQVRWTDYEPAEGQIFDFKWRLLDAFTADANKKGLNILFGIIDAPAWTRSINEPGLLGPPDDFQQAARFFAKVVARYKGCVQAIEIWNEMNLDREWTIPSRQINPADYVRFLQVVVPAIRAVDPTILIVMGALSPTGSTNPGKWMDDFEYMDQFVAAGGLQFVDCVGVHLNGYNMPPDKAWDEGYNDPTATFRGPFDNPNHSWSFKSTLFGYHEKTGKPLCVTEFGWASMENLMTRGDPPQPLDPPAPPGFEFALDNTEQEQADWIVQGFQIMRESGFVR